MSNNWKVQHYQKSVAKKALELQLLKEAVAKRLALNAAEELNNLALYDELLKDTERELTSQKDYLQEAYKEAEVLEEKSNETNE